MLSQMNGWIDRLTQFIPAKAQKKILIMKKNKKKKKRSERENCVGRECMYNY